MIDYRKERTFPLSELSRELAAARNIERSAFTLRRWINDGVEVRGRRHYLDSINIGGVRHSSLEAFDRFVEAQNQTRDSFFGN
ncbi:MAG: hypothetical protein ACYTBS_07810 [Planctomycetota bacterium]|jgi:hypothetical protein